MQKNLIIWNFKIVAFVLKGSMCRFIECLVLVVGGLTLIIQEIIRTAAVTVPFVQVPSGIKDVAPCSLIQVWDKETNCLKATHSVYLVIDPEAKFINML